MSFLGEIIKTMSDKHGQVLILKLILFSYKMLLRVYIHTGQAEKYA